MRTDRECACGPGRVSERFIVHIISAAPGSGLQS